MFHTVINNSTKLSAVEKFNYLRSSLKGDTLCFIQHIPVTESNYGVAYSELNKRFKNYRKILKLHWDAIDNLSGINSTNP